MTLEPTMPDTSAAYAQSGWGGPCEWPVDYAWCGTESTRRLDELPPEEKLRIEQMAIEYLWNWTKQKFGLCVDLLRPCRSDCFNSEPTVDWTQVRAEARAGSFRAVWGPVLIGSAWRTLACGRCGTHCNCPSPQVLQLPSQVHSVVEVSIDGVPISPDSYTLRKHDLIRHDEAWPTCQDLTLPDGAPGTWTIKVLAGEPVPAGGRMAAGLLAEEFAKKLCNDNSCALPSNWGSINRQGVQVTQADLGEMDKGFTGIWLIDSWISAVNSPRRQSAGVNSPDYGFKPRR